MWYIISWIIWSLITLLGMAGILFCRKDANSERGLDALSSTFIFSLWLISVLFLITGWNKLHIIWSTPVILFLIPAIIRRNIPVISSMVAYVIGAFLTVILAKTRTNLLDKDIDKKEKQKMKYNFQKRYKRFREINKKLIDKMMEHVPEFVMKKAAKDLHLTGPKGIFLFETEAEMCFLGDRCLYDVLWNGKNVITHFMESEDYPLLAEDEKAVVQGMTQAYYSLFEVISTEPSEGRLEFNDLLKQGNYTITDYNLSRTARSGDLLATRIRPASDYSIYFFRKYKQTEGMEYIVDDRK